MAKKDEKKSEVKKDEKKFNISHLSKELGIAPASARVQLRKNGIEKAGGRYGWDTKAEMLEVVKLLKAKAKASKKEEEEEEEDD